MSSTGARRRNSIDTRVIEGLIKNEEEFVNSLKVFGPDSSVHAIPGQSQGGSTVSANENRPKISDLGTISGDHLIDFAIVNDRFIDINVNGNLTLTFTNIPTLLLCTLRFYIRSTDPIITVGGTIVSGVGSSPLVSTDVDDFLDITIGSTDQETIFIGTVKKNDKSDEAPSVPQNITTSNHSDSSVTLSWEPPADGTLPMLYDVLYSTSAAETDGVPDSPINDPSTLDLTDLSVIIDGLSAATTYYFWVRAKNDLDASEYVGPIQTNTDGSYTAGDVGFSLTAIDFNTIRASWTQPDGKQLKFTLKRDFGGGVTETVVNNDVPAEEATNTYDDNLLEPNTEYDYIFEVRNEFGTLISTINASETTDPLAAPTVVFENVGVRLKFTITLPADVNVAELEWSPSNSVDVNGRFTVSPVVRQIARPVGVSGQTNVEFTSQILNKSTTYYGHAKLIKNTADGPWSTTASATTSDVSVPSQPGIIVTSPATGQVRIALDFNDLVSTGEWIVVSYRPQASVGPYTPFQTYYRDNPPADDLDANEDEIEVIRSGFTPGEQYTFRADAWNQSGPAANSDFDNVLVDT